VPVGNEVGNEVAVNAALAAAAAKLVEPDAMTGQGGKHPSPAAPAAACDLTGAAQLQVPEGGAANPLLRFCARLDELPWLLR
jgi:hypothetical protein